MGSKLESSKFKYLSNSKNYTEKPKKDSYFKSNLLSIVSNLQLNFVLRARKMHGREKEKVPQK